MNPRLQRFAVVVGINLIALWLVVVMNHLLAGSSLWIAPDAMFLVFPALYMRFVPGLATILLTAGWIASTRPFPFVSALLPIILAAGLLYLTRFRVRRDRAREIAAAAAGAQLITFAGLLIAGGTLLSDVESSLFNQISHILVDGLAALAVTVAVTPLFVTLQRDLLVSSGIDVAPENERL